MELIYADKYYDSPNYIEGEYLKKIQEDLLEFDNNLNATIGDIGHGADWPVVLIELFNELNWDSILKVGAIPTVFFLGKKINENLDAWFEISRKLIKLFEKEPPTRIDEKAALLLVLNDIVGENQDLIDIEILFRIHSYDYDFDINKKLTSRPDSLYLFDIRTSNSFFTYGIRSDGKISFKHKYGCHWFDFISDNK